MSEPLEIHVMQDHASLDLPLPSYQTSGAAGMDLLAAVEGPITLEPGRWRLIPTGVRVAIPHGFEAQVRPRSGLAMKHGLTVLNAPGTIDSDYRGEVGVILINLGENSFVINRGDRVAQMVFTRVVTARFVAAPELAESGRGAGGFGHTGV